jgi:Druantia protein DruA
MKKTATTRDYLLSSHERRLRAGILELLRTQGLKVGKDGLVQQRTYSKNQIRRIHTASRDERLKLEQPFVREWFPRVSKYFASGADVEPTLVDPVPVLVEDDEMSALFRLACLWWSIPVSRGFGRRFRVLVFDRANDKLLGLLGLTDPVFNLNARDSWVGWGVRGREKRLAHVMDAYVLGAVPPYNQLLGAKLVALMSTSDFIRAIFRKRYRNGRSVILERDFDGRLAMVTVTSALGRSSIYNRLTLDGVNVFQPVGFTEGYGHFHLANGTYERLRDYLTSLGEEEVTRYKFGDGPNYRIRVVRTALERLGLPPGLLRHGIRRETYVAPLAQNSAAFLRGEKQRLRWYERPLNDVIAHWRERWLIPRALRDCSYRTFEKERWRTIVGA